jgi:ABC-type transport system involved in multi-copper enzyme maturation permease subunit
MGEGDRVTRDLGLAAMSLVGVLLIILVGSGLVQKEIERQTVLTVLAKPVHRAEFLVGKYLGLMAMVTMVFVAMVLLLAGVLFIREGQVSPAVLVAAGFTYGELAVMTGVAVAFSSFVSPALSGVFTLALFAMGHFSGDLLHFAEQAGTESLAWTARGVYLVLPHLDTFNLRAEAAYGILPEPSVVVGAAAYAVLYSACLVAVGCGIFSRREFK